MNSESNSEIQFEDGRLEYVCPETHLPVVELESFNNVMISKDYEFNIKKIGDSIVYVKNSGNMLYSNMTRYYELVDKFIIEAEVKCPYIEIRDFKQLIGKPSSFEIKYQKKYLVRNQQRKLGLIFCNAPIWLRTITTVGFKTYGISTKFTTESGYSQAVAQAQKMLQQKNAHHISKMLDFAEMDFKSNWKYFNPRNDFCYKNAVIAGEILYSSIHGVPTEQDALAAMERLDLTFHEGGLKGSEYTRIVDYGHISGSTRQIRKIYADSIKQINKKYGARVKGAYVYNAPMLVQVYIKIFASREAYPVYFVKSFEDAAAQIRKAETSKKSIDKRQYSIAQKDIEETNSFFAKLLWEDASENGMNIFDASNRESFLSDQNPLHQLNDIMNVVFNEVNDLRFQDRKQLQNLMTIFESLQVGIFVVEPQLGTILFINTKAIEMVQLNTRELYSGQIDTVLIKEITSGERPEAMWSVKRADGALLPVSKKEHVIEYDGKTCRLISLVDISTHVLRENKIHEMNRELQKNSDFAEAMAQKAREADASKSEFLANMTHEIRTPMSGVIGLSKLMLESNLDESQQKMINLIQASSENLLTIVNSILDISKIESQKMELEHREVDLRRLVDNLCFVMRIRADEKKLQLLSEFDSMIPQFMVGDSTRITQVLTNLIGNAVKFTHSGSVSIECSVDSVLADGWLIRFSVTDTGIGILKEVQDGLFDKFTQANTATTRKYGGTGLGLSISKQLVELMGGDVGVASKVGVGSTFWFTLKLKSAVDQQAEDGTIDASVVESAPFVGDGHVLIVEDNAVNAFIAQKMVSKIGFTHDTAENGKVCLDMLTAGKYDAVLMDVQMPIMDGLEATKRIRNQECGVHNASIPIIAMTANVLDDDKTTCINAGMNEYLSKPLEPNDVCDSLKRYLIVD